MPQDLHIHVPTPGDHYSPATGSAIMTIIYQMARHHAARGGETQIVVSEGTRQDYDIGQCIAVPATAPPGKTGKLLDAGLGRLGLPRICGERAYTPADRAIPLDYAGPILVHNSPAPLRMLKAGHPRSHVCLWANNELFRTYGQAEIRRLAGSVDRFICCSDYIAENLRAALGAAERRIRIVRNGADVDQFRPFAGRDQLDPPVILFVGRVVPEKGAHLLVKAAAKLAGSRRFKVRIVGSSGFTDCAPLSAYEQQLRHEAASLGELVEFQPFVDRSRIPGMFDAATIFCVPSDWDDPCPLTVAEGMASGLPLVVSRRGGIPEIGGDAVLYFEPPDVDGLAGHLAGLLDDGAARRTLGERARARAEATSWKHQYQLLRQALAD